MKKRPLFTGALFAALLIWLLFGLIKLPLHPEHRDLKTGTLSGTFVKAEEKKNSFYLFLEPADFAAEEGGVRVRFSKVLLTVKKEGFESDRLHPGNRIQVSAKYAGFQHARNEGNFDEAAYFHSLGTEEKFQAEGSIRITDRRFFLLPTAMQWLKARLNEALHLAAGEDADGHAAIFSAIVTGDRSGLGEETKELYRKSGIAHILAISGLHITLIGMTLLSLFRKRFGLAAAALISGILMLLFCILSGESASAVRATVMFLIRLLALLCGKKFDLLSALGLSALLLLLSNPLLLFHSGFLLSFSAILGIGLFLPAFESLKFGGFFASLSVTLFTLPVIVNSYYEIPVFSVFLNLFVVPVMGFVLGSGLLSALGGLISLFLGRMLVGAGVYLVSLIELLCALVDKIPFSIVITGHLSPTRVLIYYGALLFGLSILRTSKKKKRRLLLLTAVLVLVLLLPLFLFRGRSGLRVTFFDVDQGESILLESPSGANFLIDAGSSSVTGLYPYRLESALKYRGISKLDCVIITHPDIDHLSGILEMLEERGAGSIRIQKIRIPFVSGNRNFESLCEKAKKAGVPVEPLHSEMVLSDSALSLRCLHPDSDFHAEEANAYSAVMELSYGKFRGLFPGDISSEEENRLLRKQALSDCNLLAVPHHGSKYSSCRDFLKAVSPEAAVISAGVKNSYGHPHREVLDRLKEAKASVYVTADSGEIFLEAKKDGSFQVRSLLGG